MGIKPDLTPLENKRVLCAVSGGADSMCLLHLLYSAGVSIAAAHFEHGIRGEEALRDAAFVESYCKENGIECIVGHGDVPGFAEQRGMGIEESARLLRYEFLQSAAEAGGFQLIATAHNADDNVETVVFNLCRGTGAAGLRGIPPARGNIIRPLLNVTRAEIEEYLREKNIPHVEDSSNKSEDYSRNLIRRQVIPKLREINPELSAAVGRTVKLLRDDDDCLCAMASAFLSRCYDGESMPTGELLQLHTAVASRVVRELCGRGLAMEHVESVLRLCCSRELAYVDLPGQRLRVERGRLWLEAGEIREIPSRELKPGEPLSVPEAGLIIHCEITEFDKEVNDLFKTYYLKYEKISPALVVSGRKPGDRLRPQGRNCEKSLKSLFAEAGYTKAQRDGTPVLRDQAGILAVYGLAVDERGRAQPGDRVLKIEFEKETTGE